MKVQSTSLEGVLVIEPKVFSDPRGWFLETWNQERYKEIGLTDPFVQNNVSRSAKNVLRGMHFQHPAGQGKLVMVLEGEIWDVALDVRTSSPQFGRWTSIQLSAVPMRQFFIPAGFAHGFCVLSDSATVLYQCTEVYSAPDEGSVRWNDPDLAISWPMASPILSPKDAEAPRLRDIPKDRLPP